MIPEDYTITDYNSKILNRKQICKRIEELKEQVLGDETLKGITVSDAYLLRFLHCTNFNINEAFKRMQDFHGFVENNPQWCITFSTPEKRKLLVSDAKVMLHCRDKAGRQVYLARIGKMDLSATYPQKEMQLDKMWFESVLSDLQTQQKGISVIVDVNGYSWRLFRWLIPAHIRFTVKAMQLYPCKEFVFHIVNTSFLVNTSIKIVWVFLSEDIKKRVKFHYSNWSSLHEHISAEVLPPEYGGSGPPVNVEELNKSLLEQTT